MAAANLINCKTKKASKTSLFALCMANKSTIKNNMTLFENLNLNQI